MHHTDATKNLEEPRPGSTVAGRYLIKREIARGGMGCVFEADHKVTGARVALKTLTRRTLDSVEARSRLMREARALGALRHPNIVSIQDAGDCPMHGPFLALEMIEGRTLGGILLAKQVLPIHQSVAITIQLCEALDEAARYGIVHRDVKPSNLLVRRGMEEDAIELIDFGVAQLQNEEIVAAEKLTKLGEVLGTVEYMAPEQIIGAAAADQRSDVYAAGVVLYECLTGEVPIAGSATAVIAALVSGVRPAPVRTRRPDVPAELEEAVQRALAVDPALRFPTARDFGQACIAALGGRAPRLDLLDSKEERSIRPVPEPEVGPTDPVPAGPGGVQRRQFVRAPYITPVRIVLDGGVTCDGRTEDISEGGVLVVTSRPCERDRKVQLRMPLPGSGRVVLLWATTRWVKTGRDQGALGLELIDVPAEVRAEIRAYVELMCGTRVPAPELRA